MATCSICNKRIGFWELSADEERDKICSKCLVKTNRIFYLIEDAGNTHQYEGAIKMCDLLIKKGDLLPENQRTEALISAYANKGISLMILEKYERAIISIEKAIKLSPKNTELLHKLVGIYFIQSKKSEALRIINKILEIKPKDKLALSLKKKNS